MPSTWRPIIMIDKDGSEDAALRKLAEEFGIILKVYYWCDVECEYCLRKRLICVRSTFFVNFML